MSRFSFLLIIPVAWAVGVTGCYHPTNVVPANTLDLGDTGPDLGDTGPDLGDSSTPDMGQANDMTAVPPLAGIKYIDIEVPADLTSDGRYALLQDFESVNGDIYVYDSYLDTTEKRGLATNPDPAMGDTTQGTPLPAQPAPGMSADTKRIVGTHGAPLQMAFLSDTTWHDLGTATATVCAGDPTNIDDQGSVGAGWDISDDGKTIVGMLWNGCGAATAVRWTDTGGAGTFTPLQYLGTGFNRPTKVSADGTIAAGYIQTAMVDRSPAVWGANGSATALDPTGMVVGEVLAISADGTMVAGPWSDTSNGGFYWTATDGVKMLAVPPGGSGPEQFFPNAIAADGQLIFGAFGDQNGLGLPVEAYVWTTKDNKVQLLQDLVQAQGYTIPPNIVLANVIAASVDGSVILGTTLDMDPTLPNPKQRAFILRMPVSIYGL